MTTATLRPDGKISAAGLADNTAPQTKLNDNSDATTISAAGGGAATAMLTLGTIALPAGSVTKSLNIRVRARAQSGYEPGRAIARIYKADLATIIATFDNNTYTYSGGNQQTKSGTPAAVTLTQAEVDGLAFWVQVNKTQTNPFPVIAAEAYVDLVYVARPAITLDTATTNLSTVTQSWAWSQPDVDGGPQAQWVARVFSAAQYGAAGFDPATSAALAEASGTTEGTVTIGGLPDGANHRIYVRAAETINGAAHWTTWVNNTFTVTLTRAEVLDVTATPATSTATISMTVNRDTSKDAWSAVQLQRMAGVNIVGSLSSMEAAPSGGVVGGYSAGVLWGAPTGVTWSTATVAGHGQVQRVTATNPAGTAATVAMWIPGLAYRVIPGDIVDVLVDMYSADWKNNGPYIGFNMSSDTAYLGWTALWVPPKVGWCRYWVRLTVPANVTNIEPLCGVSDIGGVAAAVTVDMDNLTAMINSSGWVDVPDSASNSLGGNTWTGVDYLAPADVALEYRARALKSTGTTGSWVLGTPVLTWTPTVQVVRDAANPQRQFVLAGWESDDQPSEEWTIPQGVFDVIGRTAPVVVSDVRKTGTGSFTVECATLAESATLLALLDGRKLTIVQPAFSGPTITVVPTKVTRRRVAEQITVERRYVTVEYRVVG